MRRSQASAIERPAPAADPAIMATVGLRMSCSSRDTSTRWRSNSKRLSGVSLRPAPDAIALTSPPTQNVPPAPLSSTARTSGSLAARVAASTSRNPSSGLSALRRSGRLSVRVSSPRSSDSSRTCSDFASMFALLGLGRSNDVLIAHAAAIHLVFELDDRWPGEMPGQAGPRGTPPNDLVGEERVEIMNRIDLGRGRVMPGKTERRQSPLHLAEHEPRLFAQAVRADIAARDDVVEIILVALLHFAAAGDDEGGRRIGGRRGVGESVERWLRGRIDLRTHVAARDRIDFVLEQAPLGERADIDLVEGAEFRLAERRGRAQLAGAERSSRPSRSGQDGTDPRKTLGKRHRSLKPHPRD